MNNRDIAAILFNISTILSEAKGNPYRIRAYRRAARNILRARHALSERAAADEALGIPFLGKRLTQKITQMARDGHIGTVKCDRGEMGGGLLPVRAIIEVEQRHIHDLTVNHDLQIKVKGMIIG